MVDQAEDEGGLDRHESELIRSAIEFGDMEVEEIPHPAGGHRGRGGYRHHGRDAAKLFAENGYPACPVYHEDIDDIIGVIHEKDFHAARYHGMCDVSAITSSVLYTTGNTKISELLRILQREKAHMVMVVDEYGGTGRPGHPWRTLWRSWWARSGTNTTRIIEEFKKQEDGSYLISCNADLTDLYDLFSIRGDCDANTVSGWVMEQIGRIPEGGDRFTADGLDVTVTQVDHRRVMEIKVVVLPEAPGEEEK